MNKHANTILTVDNKHTEMINNFKHNEEVILPKLKVQLSKTQELLNNIKQNNTKKNIEKKELLISKINEINNKIKSIEKEKNDYFLNNSKYIFGYFEEKQNISNNNIESRSNSKSAKINKFFNIVNEDNNEELNKETIKNSNYSNKFFYNINNMISNYDDFCYDSDICSHCKKGELIYVETEGTTICNNCSKTIKYLIENDKPSYKEPPKEVCFYAYKRINHLREILAQFQAKETTYIPDEVFENIKHQIKKERIELKDLTNKKTKDILKNLGYNKFYEHIPYIKDKLGIKPPVMSSDLEGQLCNLFMEIQKPYAKYCPKDRVNFLNYYYTLFKLCELLNQRKFLPYFPMLKDREKRIEQDQIWKKICEELGWKFIPTV
jgi:hypothetical protein